MPDAKDVIHTFGPEWKGRYALGLTKRVHGLAAARQDLVWIGLMPYVPYQIVIWGVEDVVQGNCQFHNAEAGTKMTTCSTDRVQKKMAQLGGQLL